MKLVLTGGRHYTDTNMVYDILDQFKPEYIYVGDCPTGLDSIVKRYAEEYDLPHEVFKANWSKEGLKAGPLRNRRMLESAGDVLVIAFPGGKGTEDTVKQAKLMNMMVLRVEE